MGHHAEYKSEGKAGVHCDDVGMEGAVLRALRQQPRRSAVPCSEVPNSHGYNNSTDEVVVGHSTGMTIVRGGARKQAPDDSFWFLLSLRSVS